MPAYSYLKTDLINTTENDSSEYESHIPYIVEKAERRFAKTQPAEPAPIIM